MISQLNITKRLALLIVAAVLALVGLVPLLGLNQASAAQLQSRSVTIDKSYINATDVEWHFEFDIPSDEDQEGIIYRFCTTPLGVCTAPSGMDVGSDTVTHDAQTGWPTNGTNFALATADENDCQETTNGTTELCFERTNDSDPTDGDPTPVTVTHTISGITAPDTNDTVYVRIFLYNEPDFLSGNQTDEGVVAAAFVNQLTVTARVQENLEFCVGSVDADTSGDETDDCSDISGTTVDIGVVDFNQVCVSGTGNLCEDHDSRNGLAMIRTNAQEGVLVTYYAEQDAGTNQLGALRIPGATCDVDPTEETDQCFESVGATQAAITAGSENFGMTISEVNTDNGLLTTNLTRDAEYDGDGTAGGGWAWDDSGTVDEIASSTSVIDDEMLVIRFAATAALTTPTGQYSVTSTYVATPTF